MTTNINVCHIISGDVWGGAEAQAYSLIHELHKDPLVNPCAITFNDGALATKFKNCSIPHQVICETTSSTLKIIRDIFRYLKEQKINIVHVHGFKEAFLGGIAARLQKQDVKIIRTFHGKGLTNSNFKYRFIEKLNGRFFSDQLIAVSADLKKFLLHCNFSDSMMQVIHNGVAVDDVIPSEEKESIRAALNIAPDACVIGTLGRMVPVKGHDFFLLGAKRIIAIHPDVYFVICGGGPLLRKSQEWVAAEKLEANIKIIGFRDDPYNIINCFDIFALTSLHEGIPMVLLEAMLLKKAVVTTAVGGIPEFIINNKTGITIPPKNAEAFSKACLTLLENEGLRESLARKGQEIVLSNYTASQNASKIKNIYVKVR